MRRLVLVVLLAACARPATSFQPDPPVGEEGDGGTAVAPADAGMGCSSCRTFMGAVVGPKLGDPELVELSGLVASRAHPGVFWAHNDSGDGPRVFAFDDTGAPIGRFTLTGAQARDWEDLAIGPCTATSADTCLFVGDVGDNLRIRGDYAVYRFKEPSVMKGQMAGEQTVAYERFPYEYPNGAKNNAETLLVHPKTGDVYVLTKPAGGTNAVAYRFPQPMTPGVTATLIEVSQVSVPTSADNALTGGEISPCGDAVLLRMYNRLVRLDLMTGAPFDTIFGMSPQTVPVATEQQGEAVAWAPNGRAYFTASEKVGVDPTLNRAECRP